MRRHGLAELVCSNSFKSTRFESAAGLLKLELARMGSDAARMRGGGLRPRRRRARGRPRAVLGTRRGARRRMPCHRARARRGHRYPRRALRHRRGPALLAGALEQDPCARGRGRRCRSSMPRRPSSTPRRSIAPCSSASRAMARRGRATTSTRPSRRTSTTPSSTRSSPPTASCCMTSRRAASSKRASPPRRWRAPGMTPCASAP